MMREARLKSEIRISAQLRRAQSAGAFAAIVRRGDPDAGAIAVKLYLGAARAQLFIQARDASGALIWREPLDEEQDERAIDAWLAKETAIDPDLWIIEIEDREGRAFLD